MSEIKNKLKQLRGRPLPHAPVELSGPAEFGKRLGIDKSQAVQIESVVYPADPDEPHAMPVEEALRRYGADDGKLHVRDPFVFAANGGQEHVLEIPPGAKHVQIAHRINRV